MSDEKQTKKADDSGGIDAQAKLESLATRRKVIKAALVAAPVLLTLKAKPARAQTSSAGSATSGV